MEDMNKDEQSNNHNIAIMNKLADIQTSLAVNTNETSNTKLVVAKIEVVLSEIAKQTKETNGRVSKLEEWSSQTKTVIDNTTRIANETYNNYKTDKTRIWSAVGVLLFLGGTIITLSIMAINSKIKQGISDALLNIESVKEIK
jgi:hypothetical protein